MTLKAIFKWKHPDSTVDLNTRLQTLVPRGIFDGGDVSAGGGLTVNVTPFSAIGYDGMLVQDDATTNLSVQAGQTNYVVVRAKYVTGSTPTVQWQVLTQAAYNTDADKNYLIVFAVVTVPGGAVSIASSYISMLDRDAVDPMQRNTLRGVVATTALLPAHPPEQNREGDLYFVSAEQTIYYWDSAGSSWEILGSGAYNIETTSMADVVLQSERNRIEQGSGVLGGVRPTSTTEYGFASDPDITIIETPSVVDQIGFDTFSAIVNGHYVQPHARYVTMPAKPGAGTRYDLVFLEVWREAITVPETYDFETSPDGTTTYSITEISDKTEQIVWQAGPTTGNNFDVNELQPDDHAYVVTKYRFGTVDGTALTSQMLYDNEYVASSALCSDAVHNFVANPGSGADARVWMAQNTTTSDGFSWAIPLFVVKRTSAEDWTIGQAIQEFRSDVRFVFPVYAIADQNAARKSLDTQQRAEDPSGSRTSPPYEKASGFLDSMDFSITNGTINNTIQFYADQCRIRIRGVEDHLDFNGGPDFFIAYAPTTGYTRQMVYIKLSITLYPDATTLGSTMVSARHRPYLPSGTALGSLLRGQGWKRGYCTFTVVSEDLGAMPTELDEHDAMTALGWSKGDLTLVSVNKEYQDGGIWSKAVTIDVDDRIHPYLHEWAIPVCLVHRRNKAAWHYNSNPNGTGSGRPDDRTDPNTIHPDDLVDLRRMVDVDPARLRGMLEQDIDKLTKGQLRTRMAEKWGGSGTGGTVAGSRILQTDFASITGATGFPLPAVNGTKKLWSDAREFVPVTESFDMDPALPVYNGTYVTCNRATGAITITAPIGSHLCRHLPAVYMTDGDSSQATYLQYESDPLWSTREALDDNAGYGASPWPTVVEAKVVKGATNTETSLVYTNTGWTISVSDTYGHATSMQNTIDYTTPFIAGDKCVVSFWVHYDRSVTGVYASNSGLSEIPDVVHKVERGPLSGTPADVNVGTLYANVRKTVAGAGPSTAVISAADVAAASGLSGTHTIVGIDPFNIEYSSAPLAAPTSFVLTNAQDQITVTWAGALTATVEFTVFFYTTTVDSWVEIGKGGKSVRGYYSWEDTKTHNWGGVPGSAYAFDIGTSIWHDVEVADRFIPMPQVWTNNTGLGADWTLYTGPTGGSVTYGTGYQYSGLISITDPSGGSIPNTDRYWKFVYPKWDAPTANAVDELMVHYTYTPYQGLSSTGGLIATPATALTTLKSMVHGTVEENTDHYVTQSGACSVFGGVDGWTGWPARRPNTTLNFLSHRFGEYNQTQLVKETAASGLLDFGYNANSSNLAPAAVQRLPFPMGNSMVSASYHKGTADFDLDPGREGVNAGYFSYAPAYPGLLPDYGVASGIRLDQFVNGLSRLAIPGEPKQQSQSRLIPAAAFRGHEDAVTPSDGVYDAQTCALDFAASETIYETAPIDVLQGHIVARTLTPVYNYRFEITPTVDNSDKTGLHVLHPFADFVPAAAVVGTYDVHTLSDYLYSPDIETMPNGIEAVAASVPVFIGTAPGTILAYYAYSHISVAPILTVKIAANANGADRSVLGTLATIESERQSYIGYLNVPAETASEPTGPGVNYGGSTDLIKIPLGSNTLSTAGTLNSYGSSASSLRGRSIAYPTSWNAATVTAVEAHVQASELFYTSYGRGLYLGSTTARRNMPVLVPGSGTALRDVIANAALPVTAAQPPEAFPTAPASSPFASSERRFVATDHGGPIAYGFYGLMINPAANEHKGQVVIQVTGGPNMGGGSVTGAAYTSDVVDGTALDAFWPTGRPIIKNS